MELSVSILSIKDNVKERVKELVQCSIDYLHLDIMDGLFVPNKTWNIMHIKKILPDNFENYDVHLMVNNIEEYIKNFSQLKPKYITFHIEATNEPIKIINMLKELNIKVGISIKPNTSIDVIKPYLGDIDLVLVMSVEPGFGGQKFLDFTKVKIDELCSLRQKNNYNYVIEVDGGINKDTIMNCKNSDIVVVGSYITSSNDYEEKIKELGIK